MTKRLITVFMTLGLLLSNTAFAQQDPQYSQYMFNQMVFNPAYAGSHDAVCFSALHRRQWMGFEGAPLTAVFTFNTPFKIGNSRHGVGLTAVGDKYGFSENLDAGLSYAFRFTVGPGTLSIGANANFMMRNLNATWNTGMNGRPAAEDPAIPQPTENVMGVDMGFGLFYRSDRAYIGVSSTHLLEPSLPYETAKTKLRRHYYVNAGATIAFKNPAWDFVPSFIVYSDGTSAQLTTNFNFMYNKMFWFGVGYRLNEAALAMIGVDLFHGLKLSYSFDYVYTAMREYMVAAGSHELSLSYCFSMVKKDKAVKRYKSVRFL